VQNTIVITGVKVEAVRKSNTVQMETL